MGVLSELLEKRFGIRTRSVPNPLVAAVGVAAIQVLRNNPDRVGFIFLNLSVNIIYLSPLPTVAVNAGIQLAAGGGGVAMVWDTDFELISQQWFAIATGAASAIYVLEIIGEHTETGIK